MRVYKITPKYDSPDKTRYASDRTELKSALGISDQALSKIMTKLKTNGISNTRFYVINTLSLDDRLMNNILSSSSLDQNYTEEVC